MLEYVHSVPGRLRLKISQLRDRNQAAEAEARLGAIPSVKSAAANPATGSLTISYDERRLSVEDLWESLAAQGYVSGGWPGLAVSSRSSASDTDSAWISRAVAAALLDAVLQHSARAVVRALF